MSSSMETREQRGSGWIDFAGIMLVIVGALNIVNGLNALDHKNSFSSNALMYTNLKSWGWIMLLWGIAVLLSGILVFGGSQIGRWVGILAASITMIVNMTWVFAFPIAALTVIFLAALVLYALTVFGGHHETTV
jgi:hypothetical protein